MNGDLMINLANLPPVPRLDEYFGLWAIEATRFLAAFERAQQMDLRQHVREAGEIKFRKPELLTTGMIFEDGEFAAAAFGDPAQAGAGGTADKIAVIVLSGVLMKQPGSMEQGTSTVGARVQTRMAAADPEVGGILLIIDSPGGTVSGGFDLAAEIAAADASKPVYAYIEDTGASAAYLQAVSARKIFANNETAMVGSIGTLLALLDSSGAAEKKGMKMHVYATGPLKGAGLAGTAITEAHDAYFQGIVNDTQQSFNAAVMRGRKMDAAALAKVNSGGIFMAKEAMKLGLVDGIQTLDQTIAALSIEMMKQQQKNSGAGAGRRSADNSPRILEEVIMTTSATAPAGQPGAAQPPGPSPAATLAELKTLKGSTPEFREKCMEEGLTLAQATSRHADFLQAQLESKDAQIQELTAKGRKNGLPPLTNGKKPATTENAGDFNELVAQTRRDNPSWDRQKAIRITAHNHPEAHQAFVAGCPVGTMPATSRRA